MNWLLEIAIGICLIILVSGGVNAINTYVSSRAKQEKRGKGEDPLEARLAEVERRLTDVQDVMLALNEKFDRWEENKLQG